MPLTPSPIYAKAAGVCTCTSVPWNLVRRCWIFWGFWRCVNLCMDTILQRWQQRPQYVGFPMIQLPKESLPHFPVNTPCFPADKVMNPPGCCVIGYRNKTEAAQHWMTYGITWWNFSHFRVFLFIFLTLCSTLNVKLLILLTHSMQTHLFVSMAMVETGSPELWPFFPAPWWQHGCGNTFSVWAI